MDSVTSPRPLCPQVIFRRFQVKLQRSKIAHARLRGNREAEKELRGVGMRRLNSESHLANGGDGEFLAKLERRPCGVDDEGEHDKGIPKIHNEAPEDDVTDKDLTNLVRSVMEEQPVTNTQHNIRSLSALGHILQASNISTAISDLALTETSPTNRITKSATDVSYASGKLLRPTDYVSEESKSTTKGRKLQRPVDYVSEENKGTTKGRQLQPCSVPPSPHVELPQIRLTSVNNYEQYERKPITSTNDHGYTGAKQRNINLPVVTVKKEHPSSVDPIPHATVDDVDDTYSNHDNSTVASLSSQSSNSDATNVFDTKNSVKGSHQLGQGQGQGLGLGLGLETTSNNRQSLRVQSRQRSGCPSASSRGTRSPLLSDRDDSNDQTENGTGTPRQKKTSIFEECKRPDFRKQRLATAKAVDHSDQVRSFCDGLSAFGPGVPDFDYYASKMQADASSQVKTALVDLAPDTPEEMYRKYTGDQTIKCITMPRLHMRRVGDVDDGDDANQYDSLVLDHINRCYNSDSDSESLASSQN